MPDAPTTPVSHDIESLALSDRIVRLKDKALPDGRVVSIEQARIITESYRWNDGKSRILQRAEALAAVLHGISIDIDPDELIVGNRTTRSRAGVIFPEAGLSWLDREIEQLPTRPQDRFDVSEDDIREFREDILPLWHGKTLEDRVAEECGAEIEAIAKVVKINQTDHAQGHVIPNVSKWLAFGPRGISAAAREYAATAQYHEKDFFESVAIVTEAACDFIVRFQSLAEEMIGDADSNSVRNLKEIAASCCRIANGIPRTFRDAVQSVWFLFVMLQLESNASSFSPGRLDQYLLPFLEKDLEAERTGLHEALELVEALWLKFNQIVYMRNSSGARYFAGFPIGFNVCIGGQTEDGEDAANVLSHLCLKAQEHLGLPQPNLSARLHENTPAEFLDACTRVIGKGSGMPQVFNDESIAPALEGQGISRAHAMDYAAVGCVELSPQGNSLGWSDAAMLNMVKALELAINNGKCLLTGDQLGPDCGSLDHFDSFESLEKAYSKQLDHFFERMIKLCEKVDAIHADMLPSPLLSSVIDDCLETGRDVTAGGAHYNLSGIQGIQVANVADSLAAIKKLVFDERAVSGAELLEALRDNFDGQESLRNRLLSDAPKYGNDVEWVDELGAKWARAFAEKLAKQPNARGGPYHAGFYTVSAHMPMGKNVGATPDGRLAETPLADGGLSPVYGRDKRGPTALLKSVSRIPSVHGSNGTLLNMKFLPDVFRTQADRNKFVDLLRTFVKLRIHHVQFNVVDTEDLLRAKDNPDEYRGLTVRVAGYTAYFVDLASDLQDEIIARTSYEEL